MKNVNINSILVKTFTEYTSIFYSSLQDQLTVVFGSYFQTTFCKMSTNTNINKVLQKQGFIFVVANGKFRRGPRSILPKFAGAYFSGKKKKKITNKCFRCCVKIFVNKNIFSCDICCQKQLFTRLLTD